MSVATEFAPVVLIPEHARTVRPEATVLTLHAPSPASVAPPLRLTRRGIVVLCALVAVLAGTLLALAALSSPAAPGGHAAPATVTVRSGDTLWSIASRVAPGADPRAEVAALQRLNHLGGTALTPGQVLATR
jgi:Tfp pilus assembly protein FimV